MVHVLVRHKVKDYSQWKTVFDEQAPVRQMAGSKGGRVFRNGQDPGEVAVVFEWDDIAKARIFLESKELRRVMERSGVTDNPGYFFEVEKIKE